VSATELSSASGVAKPVLHSLLKTLKQRGEIAAETLLAGTTGYRIAAGRPAEATAVTQSEL
jgi:hypothetical protein